MIWNTIFVITIVTLSFKNVLAEDDIFTDQDKKDVKMVCCGGCKDQAIMEKLKGFYQCIEQNFPDDFKKGESIFKNHKDDKDSEECWTEMSTLLDEFRKSNEENFKTLIKCFESHIPDRKLLESCHA